MVIYGEIGVYHTLIAQKDIKREKTLKSTRRHSVIYVLFHPPIGHAPVAQLDRALASGAKGRRFESFGRAIAGGALSVKI